MYSVRPMIGLMVAPLTIFCAWYGFSSIGTCAIQENGYGIQGQNYFWEVKCQQGFTTEN